MFVSHEEHTGNLAGKLDLAGVDVAVEVHHPLSYPRLILHDAGQRRPVLVTLGYFRMRLRHDEREQLVEQAAVCTYVALGGIIDVGIDASLNEIFINHHWTLNVEGRPILRRCTRCIVSRAGSLTSNQRTYLELYRLSVRLLKQLRQVNREESRNMAAVKETDVSEVDGLLEQH